MHSQYWFCTLLEAYLLHKTSMYAEKWPQVPLQLSQQKLHIFWRTSITHFRILC